MTMDREKVDSNGAAAHHPRRRCGWARSAVLLSLLTAPMACQAQERWDGWVYPDRSNLRESVPLGSFSTLDDCRGAAVGLVRHLRDRGALGADGADYECGLDCQAGEWGLNVCKRTER